MKVNEANEKYIVLMSYVDQSFIAIDFLYILLTECFWVVQKFHGRKFTLFYLFNIYIVFLTTITGQ